MKFDRSIERTRFFDADRYVPMVGVVCTTSPILILYRIVVLPALSRPSITIRSSFLDEPNSPKSLARPPPILNRTACEREREKERKRYREIEIERRVWCMRELNKQLLSNDTAAVDNLREMERDGVCDRETRSNNRRGKRRGDHSTRTRERERGAHREEGKTRARKTAMFLRNFSLTRTGIIALRREFSRFGSSTEQRDTARPLPLLSHSLSRTRIYSIDSIGLQGEPNAINSLFVRSYITRILIQQARPRTFYLSHKHKQTHACE